MDEQTRCFLTTTVIPGLQVAVDRTPTTDGAGLFLKRAWGNVLRALDEDRLVAFRVGTTVVGVLAEKDGFALHRGELIRRDGPGFVIRTDRGERGVGTIAGSEDEAMRLLKGEAK